jgi:hypothetical protein
MQRIVRMHVSQDFGRFWRNARLGFDLSTEAGIFGGVVFPSYSGDKPKRAGGKPMAEISADLQRELDQLQAAYKAAVENWVAAVREEEALASGNHNVAELDKWEAAHFREHKLHKEADYRKRLYEDALRREFYGF